MAFPPTPSTILNRIGVEWSDHASALRPYRVRSSQPCPICGRDTECLIIPEGLVTHLFCTRGEGADGAERVDRWGIKNGIWHFTRDNDGKTIAPKPVRKEQALADTATIDAVLRTTALYLGLSAEHEAKLILRGYRKEDIGPTQRHAFASLPTDPAKRYHVVSHLIAKFAAERDVLGSYGFSKGAGRGDDRPIGFIPWLEGGALVEFRRDAAGNFTGFQYAPDVPQLDSKGKVKKRISPPRLIIAGQPHIARPRCGNAVNECWHTEGIHKANLVADYRNTYAIGALGVGNTDNFLVGAKAIDPERRMRHVVAIDCDQWGKKTETQIVNSLARAGYQVTVARWDNPQPSGPDDAFVSHSTITLADETPAETNERKEVREDISYAWQFRDETSVDRAAMLAAIGTEITTRVRQHIDSKKSGVLVFTAPPGVGKSHSVAFLGQHTSAHPLGERDIAWIAQRHEMTRSIKAMEHGGYTLIHKPDAHNCPLWEVANALAAKGYNTAPLHMNHPGGPCAYMLQFQEPGSMVCMKEHAKTSYPSQHEGIVIDELDVSGWIDAKFVSGHDIQRAIAGNPVGSTIDTLARALQKMLTDAQQAHVQEKAEYPQGKTLIEALDAATHGHLSALIAALGQEDDNKWFNDRPFPSIDIDEQEEPTYVITDKIAELPPVKLPILLRRLRAEMIQWEKGAEWNSLMYIAPAVTGDLAFHVMQPVEIGKAKGKPVPPTVLLDATADHLVHGLVFQQGVDIIKANVEPPPHMQHIAIRTGKRYGKMALTSPHGKDKARAINEVRYFLAELDPNGDLMRAGKIGLITFQDIEANVRDALGIPAGNSLHFFANRGCNDLEHCEVLIILGTPMPRPEDVLRWARALYRNDPTPIDPTSSRDEDGEWRWHDARVQHLNEYLIRAEITQSAHRNRPLRHDGRTVLSFCLGEIDFLPITTKVSQMPLVTAEGITRQSDRDAKMMRAIATLEMRGEAITVENLRSEAKVRREFANIWLRAYRHEDETSTAQETTLDSPSLYTVQTRISSVSVIDSTVMVCDDIRSCEPDVTYMIA